MDLPALVVRLAVAAQLSLLLVGCSGGGSGSTPGGPSGNTNTPSQLANALIRQTDTTGSVTHLWRCADADSVLLYMAIGIFKEEPKGLWFQGTDSADQQNVEYDWKALGGDSLTLSREDGQLHDSFSYIVFSTSRSLSMVSSTHGYLSCSHHSIAETQSINLQEMSPGNTLVNEPLLSVTPPAGFSSFHTYIDFVLWPLDGTLRPARNVDALFDNGELPISINTVFKFGPERFERDYFYELDGGYIYLNNQNTNVQEGAKAFPSSPLVAGLVDERITGCFTMNASSIVDDLNETILTGVGVRWCFSANGEFTAQSGDTFAEILSTTFQAAPENTGRYRIDGYAMRLQFNNGFQIKTGFGWFDRAAREVYLLDHYPTLE